MMGGDDTPGFTPIPSALYVYCGDVDAAYQRALAAGGISLEEPANKPNGDRVAGVKGLCREYLVDRDAHLRCCIVEVRFKGERLSQI